MTSTVDQHARAQSKAPGQTCEFCAEQLVVRYVKGSKTSLSLDEHHQIFHSPCDTCLDEDGSTLCDFCSHVRLTHYMGCCRKSGLVSQEVTIRLRPFGLLEPTCSLCSFWRNLLESRPNRFVSLGDGVTMTLRPLDVWHGGNGSSLKWPLLIGPDPVAIGWVPWNLQLNGTDRFENIRVGARTRMFPSERIRVASNETPRSLANIDWKSIVEFPFGTSKPESEEVLRSFSKMEIWNKPPAGDYTGLPTTLRVIDILQDCIVALPQAAPYITLSYIWGRDTGLLHATMENMAMLEQPHGLSAHVLPSTISDAMLVCRNLGQRYLWVDRLCIAQDDPEIKVLLDAMGSIYQNSSFTIIGVDGDANAGLPGVGKARRKWTQPAISIGRLDILACAPSLRFYLRGSPWARRGWTFQEHVLSRRSLYFTHYGLYYSVADFNFEFSEVLHEGPGSALSVSDWRNSYWSALGEYSTRELTNPDDFLRAFSGFLFSMFGPDTLWGHPRANFDEMILWHDDQRRGRGRHPSIRFPSWSWTAAINSVRSRTGGDPGSIRPIAAVALWAFIQPDKDKPIVLQPASQRDHFGHSQRKSKEARDADTRSSRLAAALMFFEGCVGGDSTTKLDSLRNLTRDAMDWELTQRWPRYMDFWDEALGSLSPTDGNLFSQQIIRAASDNGRILVHTQQASFRLDPLTSINTSSMYGEVPVVIRGVADDLPAGMMYLHHRWVQIAYKSDHLYRFLAISTETESFLNYDPYVFCFGRNPSITNRFVGCECSKGEQSSMRHVALCQNHPDFRSVQDGKSSWNIIAEKLSSSLGYFDVDGKNLVEDEYRLNATRGGVFLDFPVACLNVMLVEYMPGSESISRRLGLGKIYLKKWVEAQPRFKTLVLG